MKYSMVENTLRQRDGFGGFYFHTVEWKQNEFNSWPSALTVDVTGYRESNLI